MTPQQDLGAIRTALAQLERSVASLRRSCGDTLGLRRLGTDVTRLREDLAEIGPLSPAPAPRETGQPVSLGEEYSYVPGSIPDLDDEGLGGVH